METRSAVYFLANLAIIRAVESTRPEGKRLFYDPVALGLLPPLWRAIFGLMRLPGVGAAILAVRERQTPGVIGNLLCRTRYIDDALRDALSEGVEQVVVLGAGSDTRAYRIPGIDGVRVFEVDHPATQALKQEYLRKALREFPSHVTFVPLDFDRESLEDATEAVGFRTGARTFFIWEGVTQYITAEAVDGTLRYVSMYRGQPGPAAGLRSPTSEGGSSTARIDPNLTRRSRRSSGAPGQNGSSGSIPMSQPST